MAKRLILLGFLISFLMLFGCKVSGKIEQDGVGLKGVPVMLKGVTTYIATTDSNGEYTFNSIMMGTYSVIPQKCNVAPASQTVNKMNPFEDVTDINFTFEDIIYTGDFNTTLGNTIEDLDGYTHVEGDLVIGATFLTSLEGLECLSSVSGRFDVTGNSGLTNLNGIDGLSSVNQLYIENNENLLDLDGLYSLVSANEIVITDNISLGSLNGLSNLSSVGKFQVELNTGLTSLHGIALTSVDQLYIMRNDNLTSLMGLGLLTSVDDLFISSNNSMSSFHLDSLTSVTGIFTITENINLPNELVLDLIQQSDPPGPTITICGNNGGSICP